MTKSQAPTQAPKPSTESSPSALPATLPVSHPVSHQVSQWLDRYGDLLFDLCQAVLWSQPNAQIAVRAILKDLNLYSRAGKYDIHEREWVLRVACDRLRKMTTKYGRHLSSSERMMLDASLDTAGRLRQFDSYFHRLSTDDQILLLLKDKYDMPYPEIATALGIPAGSLRIQRQQALKVLEEMLWETV
jgi:hypothetical protein